jgi:hypothetical protein
MKRRLPKSFTLLLFFFLLSNYLSATPECPIVTGAFQLPNGTTSDNSATGWSLDASHVSSSGYFAVKSNRIMAQTLGGEGVWTSKVFSTAGYSGFQAAIKITAEGQEDNTEYVKIYYRIDGGPLTLLDQRTGNWGTIDFTSGTLNGNNIQLVVKLYNYSHGSQASKYYIEQYRVFKEKGPCSVASSITVTGNGGVLTCSNPSIALSATATGSGTTSWSWTGPNNFTSTAQNPTVSTAGTYNVTATNSSGSGSTSVTVTQDKTPPTVTATGGTLSCSGSGVALSATSSVSGSTFRWTGPNGFTSSTQNPTVSTAGTYTVTVINPNNGCSTSQSVTVTAAGGAVTTIWLEDFTGLPNGTTSDNGPTAWTSSTTGTGTYSVQNGEFKTSFNQQSEGVWTSQVINISSNTNVTFSVDLRSDVASGSQFETDDYVRVYYILNGGTPVLAYEDLAGIGNSTTGTASYTFSSATLNARTLQIIIKTSDSDPTERFYFDNIKVSGVSSSSGNSTLNITQTGSVTCASTAQLQATASSTVSSWSWTGPNGFTSTAQNPVVNAGGQYSVTATLATGCTVSGVISVAENKTAPDITATGGNIGCLSGITINVNSSVSGATYSWTGPNNFTSSSKNPMVSAAGTYTATVTNPANGCTASQSVSVTAGTTTATMFNEDFNGVANGTTSRTGAYPWSVSVQNAPASAIFSVQNNEFEISNIGTSGGEGVWTSGVLDITGKTNVSISAVVRSAVTGNAQMNTNGIYADYLRFYYKLNNGAEVLFAEKDGAINNYSTTPTPVSVSGLNGTSLQIVVRGRATGNDEFYFFDNVEVVSTGAANIGATATGGTINCANNTVTLTGNSSASGVNYAWSGPNGYTSSVQNPVVNTAGNYTLTVTSGACTATATATVIADTASPNINASATPIQLTCVATNATLNGSSSTAGVTYIWSGNSGVVATTPNASIAIPGTYTLIVTNPANSCTASSQVVVTQNVTPPTGITAANSGTVTCTNPIINLNGTVTTSGLTYRWTGPNGFTSSALDTTVAKGGTYTLTATDPANGCSVSATTVVPENTAIPGEISINSSGSISCLTSSVTISGTSSTTGVNYMWTGPNGYSSTSSSITVTHGGLYTLTATNADNGCKASKSTTVTDNSAPPAVTITNTNPLSCAKQTDTLTASTAVINASYLWIAPDGSVSVEATTIASQAGTYTVTVTNPDNGCTNTLTTDVTGDPTNCSTRKVTGGAAGNATTLTTAVSSFTYSAYPNPVTANGVIQFTSPLSTTVTVGIYNTLGACEKVLFKGTAAANQPYRLAVPVDRLHAGTYYYTITTNSKMYTGKLVIVK